MPSKNRTKSRSRSRSRTKSKSKSKSGKLAVLQKKIAFLKMLMDNENDFLSVDILRSISLELDKTMLKYNSAAKIIQKKFRNHRIEKKFREEMEDQGYFQLPCGDWSNGAQCMCDECMRF